MGSIIDSLVQSVERGSNGSKVHLRQRVTDIGCHADGKRIAGITLATGKVVKAHDGVICHAHVWLLKSLIKDSRILKALNKDSPATS